MTRLIIPALVALLLSGCSKTVWLKPGATDNDFTVQYAHCRMVANQSVYVHPVGTKTSLGDAISEMIYRNSKTEDCLIANGWHEKEVK